MTINFNELTSNYNSTISEIVADSNIPFDLQNSNRERNLILLMELVRSYMAEIQCREEARVCQYTINRMIASMATTNSYTQDARIIDQLGTVRVSKIIAPVGISFDTIDLLGNTVSVSIRSFSEIPTSIELINMRLDDMPFEFYYMDGRIGVRNKTKVDASYLRSIGLSIPADQDWVDFSGTSFTLLPNTSSPNLTSLLDIAGLKIGKYESDFTKRNRKHLDDAIAHYIRNSTPRDIETCGANFYVDNNITILS